MRSDIEAARKQGYTDEQILSVLSEDGAQKGEIEGALKQGYSPTQVLTVLGEEHAAQDRAARKDQSWGEYGADLLKGVVYGAGQEAQSLGTALSRPADATGQNGVVNAAGDVLQDVGAGARNAVPGYRPAQFDIRHPIDTASELPKAVAEAAPGVGGTLLSAAGGGAAAGAAGGALAGPAGATIGGLVGGLTGAGLYAYGKYKGSNAQAHAENQGRAKPTQADFDATNGESLAMAAIDTASFKGGGLLTKAANTRLATKALQAAKGSAALGAGGAANNVIAQTAAMDETRPGQETLAGRLSNVDPIEAANAGATGAILGAGAHVAGPIAKGTIAGTAKVAGLPGELVASRLYGVDGELGRAAMTRVADQMTSKSFPGDPTKASETKTNITAIKGFAADRVNAIIENPTAYALDDRTAAAAKEARSYLNAGMVFPEASLTELKTKLGGANGEVFDALADRNAVNIMAKAAGMGEGQSGLAKVANKVLRNPGKSGVLGGTALELLPAAMHVVSGGHLAAGALAYKAMAKATGIDTALNNPLKSITRRYGSDDAATNPLRATPSGPTQAADFARLQAATQAVRNGGQPVLGAMPPDLAPTPVRGAVEPTQPSLTDLLGGQAEPRFTTRSNRPAQAEPPAAANENPDTFRTTNDVLREMRVQAEAEGQPLLDVAQLHHRSLRGIETDMSYGPEARALAGRQAKQIHTNIIAPMEAELGGKGDPAVTRARSFKQVDAGPANFTLSPEASAVLDVEMPAVMSKVIEAKSPSVVRQEIEAFIAKFGPRDRDAVRQAVAKNLNTSGTKQTAQARMIKRAARTSKAVKAAKTPAKARKPRH